MFTILRLTLTRMIICAPITRSELDVLQLESEVNREEPSSTMHDWTINGVQGCMSCIHGTSETHRHYTLTATGNCE